MHDVIQKTDLQAGYQQRIAGKPEAEYGSAISTARNEAI